MHSLPPAQSRTKLVFGVGNVNADIMFVGEGPGADEDKQGEPFVGRAGQLLNNMITAMGIMREDVYIANVVKCRPPGNRTPEKDECDTCSPFLLRQIEVIQPKMIVALGTMRASMPRTCSASTTPWRTCAARFTTSKAPSSSPPITPLLLHNHPTRNPKPGKICR